ncbi:MAG TPA: ATP-binding protein [Terriglobales bacterium]|nr:ATP-binding protein [Terriglobales bacterium]
MSSDPVTGSARADAVRGGSSDGLTGGEVAALVAGLADLRAVERVALAAAVHPAGAGFERAWLLVWSARRERLEEVDSAEASAPALELPEALRRVAGRGLSLDGGADRPSMRPQDLGPGAADAWARGVAISDGGADARVPWKGAGHVGAFTLRRSGLPWALVVGTWSTAPTAERASALENLEALCAHAGLAIDRAHELRWRARQSAALADAARAAGSTLDLSEFLQLVTRHAAQGLRARAGALWLAAPGGLRLEAAHGTARARAGAADPLLEIARGVADEGRCRSADLPSDGSGVPGPASDLEPALVCPLRAYGRALGALACRGPAPDHPSDPVGFAPADVEFLTALADLAGLAVDHAASQTKLRQAAQERREWTVRLQRQERLAWLGELAIRMTREARNPLASIAAFALRVQRALAEDDPNREYLDIVLSESRKLERLLEELLPVPAAEASLRVESLNAVAQEAVDAAAETLVRRRVRLVKKLSPDLPPLLLDRERIGRMMSHLLGNALESVSPGGRVRVESRLAGSDVVLEVAHDAPRGAGDLLEQAFVPFAVRQPGGPDVGLAVAQQIVREHGGRIRVRSEAEWSTVFTLSLPIHRNEDRRQPGPDRRRAHEDRRAQRAPA